MGRWFSFSVLAPLMAILACGLALWGWLDQAQRLNLTFGDAAYRAISSLSLSMIYDVSAAWQGDWRIDAARWLGSAAIATAVIGTLAQVLSRQVSEALGKFRRNHLLIVGDHPVARALTEAAAARRVRVTWISDAGDDATGRVPGALVVARRWHAALGAQFGAARARHCVVAFNDEVRLVAAVRELRELAPRVPITMNCGDPWFAERLDELENISGARFVSEAQVAARHVHWRHPPFLIARALGQSRIHALILGLGRGGEAALTDLLLSQLVSFLGRPRVTIVDPRAVELEASLAVRCPELAASVDLAFIDPGRHSDARVLPLAALRAAVAELPVTVSYVCLDSDPRSLAAAITLQAVARRDGWRTGPIFTRLATRGALPDLRGGQAGEVAGLVSFGATYDFAAAIGLFDNDADALPRRFHEAYRRVAPAHAAANLPWEALSEEHRESNRRLLVHMPAKLASSGFDLAAWLAVNRGDRPDGPIDAPDPAADPALLETLAELEHERWLMERRLGGWQAGPVRDNLRRQHPDLALYAALDEASKRFDREIVLATAAALRAVR